MSILIFFFLQELSLGKEREMQITQLEKMRHDKGWSKSELGRRACMQSGLVGWIETGRFTPYDVQLQRLAQALDFEGEPSELLEQVQR